MILRERFRQRVREAMAAEGINQSELARRMGATRAFVSQYVPARDPDTTAKRLPSPGLDVVEKFALALHIDDPASLLGAEVICLENA